MKIIELLLKQFDSYLRCQVIWCIRLLGENYYELAIFNFPNVNQCAYRGLSALVNLNE